MDINCLTIQIIILLLATLSPQHCVDGKEQKKPNKHYLCGEAFVDIWKVMCKIKKLKEELGGRGRKKRSPTPEEEGTVKIKRLHDILDSKTARQFLTTSVRTRRTVIRDNATEECCKEGCTYKEISEYKC